MVDTFSYKLTTESELFTFDFSEVLVSGETIIGANCSVSVMNGTDPTPNNILISSPLVSTPTVAQRIDNGVADTVYRIAMTIDTSAGNTYTGLADLPIYDPLLV
jgi:hypothetical protein